MPQPKSTSCCRWPSSRTTRSLRRIDPDLAASSAVSTSVSRFGGEKFGLGRKVNFSTLPGRAFRRALRTGKRTHGAARAALSARGRVFSLGLLAVPLLRRIAKQLLEPRLFFLLVVGTQRLVVDCQQPRHVAIAASRESPWSWSVAGWSCATGSASGGSRPAPLSVRWPAPGPPAPARRRLTSCPLLKAPLLAAPAARRQSTPKSPTGAGSRIAAQSPV